MMAETHYTMIINLVSCAPVLFIQICGIKQCFTKFNKAFVAFFYSLMLERGGEHVIGTSSTKMIISRLIYKISRHMIHHKIAYIQVF